MRKKCSETDRNRFWLASFYRHLFSFFPSLWKECFKLFLLFFPKPGFNSRNELWGNWVSFKLQRFLYFHSIFSFSLFLQFFSFIFFFPPPLFFTRWKITDSLLYGRLVVIGIETAPDGKDPSLSRDKPKKRLDTSAPFLAFSPQRIPLSFSSFY